MNDNIKKNGTLDTSVLKLKLWNPRAIGLWSIVFSPIFGAVIHAINWKKLNKPNMMWINVIWVILIIIMILVLPDDTNSIPSLLIWIFWYGLTARKQKEYIEENNIDYEPKPLFKLIAILGGFLIITIVAMFYIPA